MKKIILFNPSCGTQNMGDYIIENSIKREMNFLFEKNYLINFSTHTPMNHFYQMFRKNRLDRACEESSYKFLCGSNMIKDNLLELTPDFNVNIFDLRFYKDSISIGCGMGGNTIKNKYTKYIYKKILSNNFYHSVRDEKTKIEFEKLGKKAINTGCPTIWALTKEHCRKIPTKKSESVIFTLTDYEREEELDKLLISILKKNYKKVYYWVQGIEDLEYLKKISNDKNIIIVPPSLDEYSKVLDKENVEYVGTRLHAGIFALQHMKRSFILSIDNRARDMKESYNLPIIERRLIETELEKIINNDYITDVRINEEAINKWKAQFDERQYEN